MIGDARGVLLFEFDGLLFGVAAEFTRILTLPAKADVFHAALEIFHGNCHDNLLVRRHVKRLPVLRDFSRLLCLKIICLPDESWGRGIGSGKRDRRDWLQTPHQGENKDKHGSVKCASPKQGISCMTISHLALLLYHDLSGANRSPID